MQNVYENPPILYILFYDERNSQSRVTCETHTYKCANAWYSPKNDIQKVYNKEKGTNVPIW